MERGSATYWILIILLILVLGGVISLGDIFSVIFYIILGVLALAVIGGMIFRAKIRRMQREAEAEGRQWTGYHPFENRTSRPNGNEGEVKLHRGTSDRSKTVGKDVGEYVDFEDVDTASNNDNSGKSDNR